MFSIFYWVMVMSNQHGKAEEIEQQIARYDKSVRRRLRKLSRLSPRLADLIDSFPAAAYVIATQSVTPEQAGEAVRRVKDGCALREVAQPLGLPMWLKRVPPEAFSGVIAGVPDGDKFARQIAGRIPRDPDKAVSWLAGVCYAGKAADVDFALWIASHRPLVRRPLAGGCNPLRPLAVFAWFSALPGGPARDLIEKPWQPSMRLETAVRGMQGWLDGMAQAFRPTRPRRGPGRYSMKSPSGLRMVPLRTGAQLRDEGQQMDHCVGTYAQAVASGQCLIFSVREGARRLATVELRRQSRSNAYSITQLQGPGNSRVSENVWHFTHDWVKRFSVNPEIANDGVESGFVVKKTDWFRYFGPYIHAKGEAGFEPRPQSLELLLAEAECLRTDG